MDDPISTTGLQFFGAMTASISHEIKNRMAIINEQAGLLADFVQMAKNGRPLDENRLDRLAASVRTQVALADNIIKNMNQFAHSVDIFFSAIDLRDLLNLMEMLFKRRAENAGVHLKITASDEPVAMETSPFLLMNLMWLCLLPVFTEKTADQQVTISLAKNENQVRISMALERMDHSKGWVISEETENLAKPLGAVMNLNSDGNLLRMELPIKPLSHSMV